MAEQKQARGSPANTTAVPSVGELTASPEVSAAERIAAENVNQENLRKGDATIGASARMVAELEGEVESLREENKALSTERTALEDEKMAMEVSMAASSQQVLQCLLVHVRVLTMRGS